MAFRTEIPIVVLNVDSPYNPIASAPIVVYSRNADGTRGSASTVYSSADPNNSATIANPGITTDAAGRVTGWLNRGAYEVVISVPGHPDYSEFLDSTPADDGSIDTSWIADSAVTTVKLAANAVTAAKITAGTITNTEISGSAAIAYSKLALSGSVLNADIAASAGVALSKLASVTAAQLLVGNGSGVVTGTTLSGDATITSGGALTLANSAVTSAKIADGTIATGDLADAAVTALKVADGVITGGSAGAGVKIAASTITNANINAAAAIAYSKLSLTGSVVNADVSGSAAIAYSKLNLAGSVVNADIGASAAIVRSKLDFGSGLVNADVASGAAIAYSKLNLTGSVVNADLSASAGIAASKLATVTPGYVLMGAPTTGTVTATQLHGDISVAPDGTVTVASVSGSSVGANSIGPAQLTRVAAGKLLVTQGTGSDSAYNAPSGDVTIDSAAVTTIGENKVDSGKLKSDAGTDANRAVTTNHIRDSAVTNAKITTNTITPSKLARDTSGSVLIAQGVGADSAFTALSGDLTLAPTGVATVSNDAVTTAKILNSAVTSAKIADGTIVDADISGSAAVAYSKLSLASSIQNSDLKSTVGSEAVNTNVIRDSAVTSAKIASGTIINADVSSSAGITSSKLDSGFLAQVGVSDVSNTRRGHFERTATDSLATTGTIAFSWINGGIGNPGIHDDGFTNMTFPSSGMALVVYRAQVRVLTLVSGSLTLSAAFTFYDGVTNTPATTIFGDGSVADSVNVTHTHWMEIYTTGTTSDGTNGMQIKDKWSGGGNTEPTESSTAQMYAVPLFFFVPAGGTYTFGMKFSGTNGGTIQLRNRRLDLVTFATS